MSRKPTDGRRSGPLPLFTEPMHRKTIHIDLKTLKRVTAGCEKRDLSESTGLRMLIKAGIKHLRW